MNGMAWIKVSTGIFNNSKIKYIQSLPDGDSLVVIWLQLLCLAGREHPEGVLIMSGNVPYTAELLASMFAEPVNTVRLALETFRRLQMIETCNGAVTLCNWKALQVTEGYERAKQKSKERVKSYRERQRLLKMNPEKQPTIEKCNVTVTLRNAVEEEVEEEEEKKKNNNPPLGAKAPNTPLAVCKEFAGDNGELLEALRSWVDMRKKMKRPLTVRATAMALKKLNELAGGNQDTMIKIADQSVLKGWQTFYALKGGGFQRAVEFGKRAAEGTSNNDYSAFYAEMEELTHG